MRLSELLGRPVETESGRSLGRLHDLRTDLATSPPRVVGLVVGGRGGLERLGIAAPRARQRMRSPGAVPWDRVVRLEPDRIVVDDRD